MLNINFFRGITIKQIKAKKAAAERLLAYVADKKAEAIAHRSAVIKAMGDEIRELTEI